MYPQFFQAITVQGRSYTLANNNIVELIGFEVHQRYKMINPILHPSGYLFSYLDEPHVADGNNIYNVLTGEKLMPLSPVESRYYTWADITFHVSLNEKTVARVDEYDGEEEEVC